MKEEHGLTIKELREIIDDELAAFSAFTCWATDTKKEFEILLNELKKPYDKNEQTKRQKGDRLEKLVEFIIEKTYFFEVYKNVHTETNEVDEVIVLSNKGKQALHSFNLSRELIPISEDVFIGECKNYENGVGVTYVGKFYSLMTVTGMSFGIIFTQNGLTGNSAGYKDAYGLAKVLRMIENTKNKEGKDFYILTFTIEDYEKMLNGTTFFDLVKAKKLEMKLASSYENFLLDNKHEAEDEVKRIVRDCL